MSDFTIGTLPVFQFKSAVRFWAGAEKAAAEHTEIGGRVFLYSWDYISPRMFVGKPWRGAVHTGDLTYLFGKRHTPQEFSRRGAFHTDDLTYLYAGRWGSAPNPGAASPQEYNCGLRPQTPAGGSLNGV